MKNNTFDITFDTEKGILTGLKLVGDPKEANFIKQGRGLAELRSFPSCAADGKVPTYRNALATYDFNGFEEKENVAVAKFSHKGVAVEEKFSLTENDLRIVITVKNENAYPVYFSREDIALYVPFADSYDSSIVATDVRCHEHIADCGENSYVRAERMGESDYNVGLLVLKGDIFSYSQEDSPNSNDRGFFALNVAPFSLLAGGTYTVEFAVFAHRGGDDFFKRAKKYPEYIHVSAEQGYTMTLKEKRAFTLTAFSDIKKAEVTCNGKKLPVKIEGKVATVTVPGKTLGEKRVEYEVNGRKGFALFNVILPVWELAKRRLKFITEKQQCLDKKSPLYGAFLVYDNEEKRQYFSYNWRDQNASRERHGMGILLAKYLQTHKNAKFRQSLDRYTEFMLREVVDEKTGRVSDTIGKDDKFVRLYNAPWVMEYFYEVYKLSPKEKYLKLLVKMLTYFYENGGTKFYPNAVHFSDFVLLLKEKGKKEDYEKVAAFVREHADNIAKTGVAYPPHEVNFEQTIVSPAVCVLLNEYVISEDEIYLREAEKHLKILKKFDGCQPDYHRNKIAIRYWDDFWFGKTASRIYGDTFPHYWCSLTGDCFALYGKLTGEQKWIEYGKQNIQNCMCLFNEKGEGSCAYVYPYRVNGVRGKFFDPFANDQDFALYFALRFYNKVPV